MLEPSIVSDLSPNVSNHLMMYLNIDWGTGFIYRTCPQFIQWYPDTWCI